MIKPAPIDPTVHDQIVRAIAEEIGFQYCKYATSFYTLSLPEGDPRQRGIAGLLAAAPPPSQPMNPRHESVGDYVMKST